MTKPRDVVCVGGRLRLSSTTALAQLLHDLALQQNKQSIISIGMDGTESMKLNDTDVEIDFRGLLGGWVTKAYSSNPVFVQRAGCIMVEGTHYFS